VVLSGNLMKRIINGNAELKAAVSVLKEKVAV
jgi:hypothetical protein